YLIFSGIVNIIANYILVVFFSMGAAGVSLATALSFALSAVLVIRAMSGMPGAMKFKRTLLKIDWKIFREMLRIGLPAGIHGCLFAISNVVIQGAINSFGSTAMAGSAAALNIETIIYAGSFSFNQAATSFAGQNMGAKKYDRVKKSAVYCIITSGVMVGAVGAVCTIFGRQLLSIYNPNPEIISKGMERAIAVFLSYGLCAIMDSISGTLRGMGKSFGPMLLSIFGVCFVRIVWVWSIFRLHKTLSMLMLSYPVSYAVTIVLTGWMLKKELAKYMEHKNSGYSTVAKV
ncbi:MAG: MATE family efflux transporter, partial [Lentisphaeria bacterium]|nr:MATE family efflux transporter [Lentisphaeria bacterium]